MLAALLSAVLLAACGSSSKPAYCQDVSNFKAAVKQLGSDEVLKNGVSSLTAAVEKVETTGKTAVSAVKTQFAPQTEAIKSSLTSLQKTVGQLSSSSTRTSALTELPGEIESTVTAVNSFTKAAETNCK